MGPMLGVGLDENLSDHNWMKSNFAGPIIILAFLQCMANENKIRD